jgi:hypothetical protein
MSLTSGEIKICTHTSGPIENAQEHCDKARRPQDNSDSDRLQSQALRFRILSVVAKSKDRTVLVKN